MRGLPGGSGSPARIGSPRLGRGAHQPRQDQRELEQRQERRHLDQHRHRIGAGQQHRDDREDQVRVAAVVGELLRGDDPEPGDREDPDRDLEDEPEREQGE